MADRCRSEDDLQGEPWPPGSISHGRDILAATGHLISCVAAGQTADYYRRVRFFGLPLERFCSSPKRDTSLLSSGTRLERQFRFA